MFTLISVFQILCLLHATLVYSHPVSPNISLVAKDTLTTRSICKDSYVANYNDIAALPGTDPGLNPPPTPYKYLAYKGFSANQAGIPILGRTDGSIYYAVQTRALLGEPSVSKDYTNSPVQYFDAKSFTFVCVAQSALSVKGIGVSCTLKVTGIKRDGTLVSTVCGFYQPLESASITPAKCELKGFDGVVKVSFATTNPAVVTLALVTAVDNFDLTVYRKC